MSELLRLLKSGYLGHPTSNSFSVQAWRDAFDKIAEPSDGDRALLLAALFVNNVIRPFRRKLNALPIGGTRRAALTLLVATANQQYLVLQNKLKKSPTDRQSSEKVKSFQLENKRLIESAVGQKLTADDHITHLIDSLPNWLHAINTSDGEVGDGDDCHNLDDGLRLLTLFSYERAWRDIWQSVIWQGRKIESCDCQYILRVKDRELEERWLIWRLRQESLMMFNFVFDAGHQMALGSDRLPPVNPVQPKTVIRLKRYRFGRFSPVVGQARPYDERQRRHVNNREMLDRTYLTAFLDVEVPNDVVSNATCKDLLRVWWILSDIAGCLTEYLSGAPARDGEVAWLSATITKRDLERCVADSLSVDLVRAAALLQHFIFRPTSTSEIFEQSFWWTPLVPITPDLISVLIPPLLVGDPMRLMEGILRRSGVINLKGESNRGKVFEKHVRKVVSEALNENELLGEAIVLMEDFKRDEDGGEEIDLVVKIGNVVLIGEAKCLLPPTDPAGRHNYAKQLMGAASQASRKAEFARSKPESVLSALGVTVDDQDQVKFVPLVVLNQGIGHGFASGDVALVDLHWLESLLVSGTTVVGMAFKEGSAIQFEHEMYFSLEDFEMKVEELLLRPPPMGRYSGAIAWRLENIPLGEGGALALEVPYLAKPI